MSFESTMANPTDIENSAGKIKKTTVTVIKVKVKMAQSHTKEK